jgi:hypothetical protein
MAAIPAAESPSVKNRLARVRAAIAAQVNQPSDVSVPLRSFNDRPKNGF